MSSQDNINLVKKYIEEVHNKGNLSAMDQFLSSSFTVYDQALPHQKENLSQYKETEALYKKAFPNKNVKIDDIFSTEDKVTARWTVQGTQKGTFKDVSATNKNVKISGISTYQIKNGKISEIHQVWDRLGLLEQLGEIQPAAAFH